MGETLRLTAEDGHRLDAYLARPEGEPKAGLVVIPEIFGVNVHIREVTDSFAGDGYLAIAPALFDRAQRDVDLGYTPDDVAKGRAIRGEIGWDEALRDVAAALEAVSAAGKVGTVGYCWGGSVAWLAACRLPVAAAVCYYGGQIHEFRHETPACPTLLHFGTEDSGIPLSDVEEVRASHPDLELFLYPAGHGFNCDHRSAYDADSAAQALERTLGFFARNLS